MWDGETAYDKLLAIQNTGFILEFNSTISSRLRGGLYSHLFIYLFIYYCV